jgi:hypothetical protein
LEPPEVMSGRFANRPYGLAKNVDDGKRRNRSPKPIPIRLPDEQLPVPDHFLPVQPDGRPGENEVDVQGALHLSFKT